MIATYDPTQPIRDHRQASTAGAPPLGASPGHLQLIRHSEIAQPVAGDVVGASLRSVRYSEGTALQFIQRAAQPRDDPDGLPYADPIFWAAFTVTGC